MPTDDVIASEEQKLYESPSLRDDLNDAEATRLLEWGQTQVRRLAEDYPDDFESQTRSLRQLIKAINRFVGQREFQQTREGEDKYMSKIMMWLPKLGWEDITADQLYAVLPDDKADMAGTLDAILQVLSPPPTTTADGQATLSANTEGLSDAAMQSESPSNAPQAPQMPAAGDDIAPQDDHPFAPPRTTAPDTRENGTQGDTNNENDQQESSSNPAGQGSADDDDDDLSD